MLETSEMAALGINDEWGNCVISFPKIKSAQILRVIHLRVDQEMMNRCRRTDRTKKKLLTLHALRKIEPYYSAVVESYGQFVAASKVIDTLKNYRRV